MRELMAVLVLAGCTDPSFLIVTVDRRPAVHNVTKLKVDLANSGSVRGDTLDLAGHEFPVTFSVSTDGRSGELGITVQGLDAMDNLVGKGTGTTTFADMTASVMLDSADFVVNTQVANNQFLTTDFEAVGLQLAAISNGTWMAVFRDECTMCEVFGRRFDPTGLAVTSALAASDMQFPVSTTLTSSGTFPAIAASGTNTMVFWDYFDTVGTGQGVACRAINDAGSGLPAQQSISTDSADVVTAAALSNGNFAVTWQTFMTTEVVRSVVVRPDCTTLGPATTISTGTATLGHRRSHVAANGASILYAWIADNEVRVRPAPNTGVPTATESKIILKTPSMDVDHVRLVAYGTGFAVAARWSTNTGDGPGKIEVYRTDATGVVQGTPTLITTNSGSDFASDKAFGLAARADGALLVTWHACPTGPGTCEVYGRLMRPTGVPVGDEFVIPTSTGSDQVNPSVVALDQAFVVSWNDSSGLAPDKSGSAVRARIVYPVYDDARSVIGATCGASAPGAPACGEGLACATGSDQVQRCFATCTPPTCTGGGTCSTVDGGTSACTF